MEEAPPTVLCGAGVTALPAWPSSFPFGRVLRPTTRVAHSLPPRPLSPSPSPLSGILASPTKFYACAVHTLSHLVKFENF